MGTGRKSTVISPDVLKAYQKYTMAKNVKYDWGGYKWAINTSGWTSSTTATSSDYIVFDSVNDIQLPAIKPKNKNLNMRVIDTGERKAIKEHKCEWCSENIETGERYKYSKCVDDGDFLGEWKAHKECWSAASREIRDYPELADDGFDPFTHKRGLTTNEVDEGFILCELCQQPADKTDLFECGACEGVACIECSVEEMGELCKDCCDG
jgi:hypothetical protein